MEKFHFNPIALDTWSRQFFTSLQTLHIYDEEDNCIDSLEGVVESLLREKSKSGYLDVEDIDHLFAGPTYLKIDDDYFPKVKILGLIVTAEIKKTALVGTGDIVENIKVQVMKQFLQ